MPILPRDLVPNAWNVVISTGLPDDPRSVPMTPQSLRLSLETTEEYCDRMGYDDRYCYIMENCRVTAGANPNVQCNGRAIDYMEDIVRTDVIMALGEQIYHLGSASVGAIEEALACYDPMWAGVWYCPL